MKISNNTTEVIERFKMDFMNETRGCMFKEDTPKLIIGGKKFGPFKTGDQTDLPNWVIEKLLMHNLVSLLPEDAYESIRRLQNLYRAEEKQPHKLQSFHPYLYSAINQKILRLQSDKTSLDPRKYEEIEKMQRIVPFLIETRLSKILRVAKSGAFQEKKKQMTYEERWLCEEILKILTSWRERVVI